MITIGHLTAEGLQGMDRESVQTPLDMVPSAHFVVDALRKRGSKSHNLVLSQWGHISAGKTGKHTRPLLGPPSAMLCNMQCQLLCSHMLATIVCIMKRFPRVRGFTASSCQP